MDQVRFPVQYWGSVSYFQELIRHKEICLEVFETYPKQTLRNRTTILTGNGLLDLTIPVVKPMGSKTRTKDILIDYSQNWQKIHWRAISSAYAYAPYFEHYTRDIQQLLFRDEKSLVDFNIGLIRFIITHLELPVELALSEEFDKNASLDYLKMLDIRSSLPDYSYQQVFPLNGCFVPDLSILDALFNLGPMARKIIYSQSA